MIQRLFKPGEIDESEGGKPISRVPVALEQPLHAQDVVRPGQPGQGAAGQQRDQRQAVDRHAGVDRGLPVSTQDVEHEPDDGVPEEDRHQHHDDEPEQETDVDASAGDAPADAVRGE